ncbi:hypothetical protein JKP88DRAFT_242415 [Tribonema minus]|uniref:Uncharacterized protein n=1 Tax=Tribonema minus TaxID=303371 RepID=A0A836C823_9STRA|nr:hypothetical protein JKP88DRAFT_242415 [Tribonema minus]
MRRAAAAVLAVTITTALAGSNGLRFTPDMVHSTLSALARDHMWYLNAMGVRAGRSLGSSTCTSAKSAIQAAAADAEKKCVLSLMCDVGVPPMGFFECLASNAANTKASPVFSTSFSDSTKALCKTCGGKKGTDLTTCVDANDSFIADDSCSLTVFSPYYENDADGSHFDGLFKDPSGKITDETLAMVAAVCNDGHCYDQLYDAVQALLALVHDGGSCLDAFNHNTGERPTSSTDFSSMDEGAKGSSAQPISCLKTFSDIMDAYNDTDTSVTVAAMCPSASNNELEKSGCCMREIVAGAPPLVSAPDFWTDLDAGCGLHLSDTNPDTMLQFCPSARGSAQSFVIGLHIAGVNVCNDATMLSAVKEATATALSIQSSQVAISSCTYASSRVRERKARGLVAGTSSVGVTVSAIGTAQINAMDDCKTAALSAAYPTAIASSLGVASSSVTADSTVAGEMSAEGTSSAPRTAAAMGAALLTALLAAAALVL